MKTIHNIANALLSPVCYAIPHLPNGCMAKILTLFSFIKISKNRRNKNLAANKKTLAAASAKKDDFFSPGHFIENQRHWQTVRFGLSTMQYSGCEIMAVYNALLDLGKKMTAQDMAELIHEFEQKGAVLGGLWGCAPRSIQQYFIHHGYRVAMTTSAHPDTINAIGKTSDSIIITAYNDKNDIRKMIHTISITKDELGNYTLHNVYKQINGRYTAHSKNPPIKNLWDTIGEISLRRAASICVIGISATRTMAHL